MHIKYNQVILKKADVLSCPRNTFFDKNLFRATIRQIIFLKIFMQTKSTELQKKIKLIRTSYKEFETQRAIIDQLNERTDTLNLVWIVGRKNKEAVSAIGIGAAEEDIYAMKPILLKEFSPYLTIYIESGEEKQPKLILPIESLILIARTLGLDLSKDRSIPFYRDYERRRNASINLAMTLAHLEKKQEIQTNIPEKKQNFYKK